MVVAQVVQFEDRFNLTERASFSFKTSTYIVKDTNRRNVEAQRSWLVEWWKVQILNRSYCGIVESVYRNICTCLSPASVLRVRLGLLRSQSSKSVGEEAPDVCLARASEPNSYVSYAQAGGAVNATTTPPSRRQRRVDRTCCPICPRPIITQLDSGSAHQRTAPAFCWTSPLGNV